MQGDKVLVVNGLLVDVVPVIVIVIHWRDPLLGLRNDHPPDAAEAMQVNYEEENELVQLQESLEFFR